MNKLRDKFLRLTFFIALWGIIATSIVTQTTDAYEGRPSEIKWVIESKQEVISKQIESIKLTTREFRKLESEYKDKDPLSIEVSEIKTKLEELKVDKIVIDDTLDSIAIASNYHKAHDSVETLVKNVEKAQKDEQERIRKEEERKKAEEAARVQAQQSARQSTGSSKPATTPKTTSTQSKQYTRTDWMWDLIYSYPEPARRGLQGATIVSSLGGNYAGMTYVSEMRFEVANWIKDNTFRGTVAHELGHIYHIRTGADETAEWQEIYRAEWASSGHYGGNNAKEAFAETFKSMYEPGSYNARSTSSIPRSVQFMRNLIASGR